MRPSIPGGAAARKATVAHDRGVLVLTRAEVESLLDLDDLVEAVAAAMIDLSAGRASAPPRIASVVPDVGLLGAMPAYLPSAAVLETKLVSVFPGNASLGVPTHQAAIVVFDPMTGTPAALMDGTYITETRTAAGSALSVRTLARPDASVVAILGTGVQARAHARAVSRVMSVGELRVAGRSQAKAEALAAWVASTLDVPARAVESWSSACEGADVVCACTHSEEPVVARGWLAPGTHVASVGWTPSGGEIDAPTVRDSLVVVESRESALAEGVAGAGDLTGPLSAGELSAHEVAEIGEILAGDRRGRASDDQLTLYKSVGVAVQDAAAAALVLNAAMSRGVGAVVDL
jgi:ornithine cyclodeaminase